MKVLSAAALALFFCAAACAQTPDGAADDAALPPLSPLELKIGQLLIPACDVSNAARFIPAITRGAIGGLLVQWGGFDLKKTAAAIAPLQRAAAKSPLRLPLLAAADYEGGPVFSPETLGLPDLPTNMMIGAAGSEKDCAMLAYLSGLELKKAGLNLDFAPVLDINTEPSNPIIGVRAFGDNPYEAARLGAAVAHGFQAAGIAAVAKHFPGHGAAKLDSHLEIPRITLSREDMELHERPFARAISEGVPVIMTAHAVYPALDAGNIATFSTAVVNGLLRGEMGYKGVVVSDSLEMKAASGEIGIGRAAVRALKAGVNLLLIGSGDPGETIAAIRSAVESGELPAARIEESCRLVSALKKKYAKPARRSGGLEVSQTYRDVSRSIARDGVTLVRNAEGLVPLAPAASRTICAVFFTPPRFSGGMTAFSGPLMKKGWKVTLYNSRAEPAAADEARALECAKNADITIAGSFQWAAKPVRSQVALIKKLLSSSKRTVLLSLMSPYDIPSYPEAKTVLALYGATRFSAEAAAEIIAGAIQPKGRLPVKLPSN